MFCPNCGAENADSSHTCQKCGFNLKDQGGPPAPKFKGTMLMMAQDLPLGGGDQTGPQASPTAQSQGVANAGAAAPDRPVIPRPSGASGVAPGVTMKSKLKGTMIGVAPPPAGAIAPPEPAPKFNSTLVAGSSPQGAPGVGTPDVPPPQQSTTAAGPGDTVPQAAVNPMGGTLIAGTTPSPEANAPAGNAPFAPGGTVMMASSATVPQAVSSNAQQGWETRPMPAQEMKPPVDSVHPGLPDGTDRPMGAPPGAPMGAPFAPPGAPMAAPPGAPGGALPSAVGSPMGMSRSAVHTGGVFPEQSPIQVFVLGMVTCGIHTLFWAREIKHRMEAAGQQVGTTWFLLIPILNLIWLWKWSQAVEAISRGRLSAVSSFLKLWLLGVIGAAWLQSSFNDLK